jgi:hypothetical protein
VLDSIILPFALRIPGPPRLGFAVLDYIQSVELAAGAVEGMSMPAWSAFRAKRGLNCKKLADDAPSSYCQLAIVARGVTNACGHAIAAAVPVQNRLEAKIEESVGGRLAQDYMRASLRLPSSFKSQINDRMERAPRSFR